MPLSPVSHHFLLSLITFSCLSSLSPVSHHFLLSLITFSCLSSLCPVSHHFLLSLITSSVSGPNTLLHKIFSAYNLPFKWKTKLYIWTKQQIKLKLFFIYLCLWIENEKEDILSWVTANILSIWSSLRKQHWAIPLSERSVSVLFRDSCAMFFFFCYFPASVGKL
jgi:hypothetical protein